jgi:hypothetical protein
MYKSRLADLRNPETAVVTMIVYNAYICSVEQLKEMVERNVMEGHKL